MLSKKKLLALVSCILALRCQLSYTQIICCLAAMTARPNSKTGRGSKRKADNHDLKEDTPSLDNKKEKPEDAGIKEEGQKIVIEHSKSCRVYRQHAEAVKSTIQAAHPDLCVELNPQKPRKYSFEINLVDAGKETCLWNGIKMGPPARLKFPDSEKVLSILKAALDSK